MVSQGSAPPEPSFLRQDAHCHQYTTIRRGLHSYHARDSRSKCRQRRGSSRSHRLIGARALRPSFLFRWPLQCKVDVLFVVLVILLVILLVLVWVFLLVMVVVLVLVWVFLLVS